VLGHKNYARGRKINEYDDNSSIGRDLLEIRGILGII